MSVHVLLNLLNELGKRDKMQRLSIILSLFRNKFNKFNNTEAHMLDSIYQMTLKLIKNCIFFCRKFSFTATRKRSRKTLFPNVYPTIYLPK